MKSMMIVAAAAVMLAGSLSVQASPGDMALSPIGLVEQSGSVLKVKLKIGDKPTIIEAETIESYKPGPKKFTIDLEGCPFPKKIAAVTKLVKNRGDQFGLVFIGEFDKLQEDMPAPHRSMASAYLHLGQFHWVSLVKTKDAGRFEMLDIEGEMEWTWAGSTDMLDRCVRYVLAAKREAAVPLYIDANWSNEGDKIGNVPGRLAGAMPVPLDGGRDALFIMSDANDALFVYDEKAKQLVDATGQRKLTSKSRAAAWGDFNRDGRSDLASWDGQALSLHMQQPDGTFVAQQTDTGDALRSSCVSLAVIDTGDKGELGLLAGTPGGPVVLKTTAPGTMAGTLLAAPPASQPDELSAYAGQCLVADFDNDGQPDVLQLFNSRGVFYRGVGPGQFAKGEPSPVHFGKGRGKGVLGDFDHDGLLDVFTVGEDKCRIWQNRGGAKFDEVIGQSGEIYYISRPGAIDAQACDINNDGRPDVLVVYGGMKAQLFFNRGWRNMSHAHGPIDLSEQNMVEPAADGQQAGCMGDFNGDGGQDMTVVCPRGDVYVLYREVLEGEGLMVQVTRSGKAGPAGPVNVTARYDVAVDADGHPDKLSLGAWPVTAGGSSANFGLRQRGMLHLKWTLPGGQTRTKTVKVVEGTTQLVLDDGE